MCGNETKIGVTGGNESRRRDALREGEEEEDALTAQHSLLCCAPLCTHSKTEKV
jgi:hypothetical protein